MNLEHWAADHLLPLLRVSQFLALFLIAVGTAGCLDLGDVSHDEVARLRSPSGSVDAVLVETNGGATTSFGYEVHLTPVGRGPDSASLAATLYGAVRSDSAYGVNMRWENSGTLAVEYLDAKSTELVRPAMTIGGDRVHTRFRAGVRDPDAPGGGMLYNLSRRTP